jgi:demethylmenaquinone methyltransferase/2-methoxy-6-polyprenyl-1,4-benzoquinol methylase
MLRLASTKVGRGPRVWFVLGDALSLPFPDDTFACAASAFTLRNLTDLRRGLMEMARVVRPGGRVVTLEITPRYINSPLRPLMHLYLHRIIPLLGGLITGDREAYSYLARSIDRFLPPDMLAHLLEDIGLEEVSYCLLGLGTVAIHQGTKRG